MNIPEDEAGKFYHDGYTERLGIQIFLASFFPFCFLPEEGCAVFLVLQLVILSL